MSAPYEVFAQRQLNELAHQNGKLRTELAIIRSTLNSMMNTVSDGGTEDELRDLVKRIDIALEDRT